MLRTVTICFLSLVLALLIFGVVRKHLQTACYSGNAIVSESAAIDAAKRLIVENDVFYFPDIGISRDFVKFLCLECCEAIRFFSLTYLSTVWQVHIVSLGYHAFIDMDECGRRIFERGMIAL